MSEDLLPTASRYLSTVIERLPLVGHPVVEATVERVLRKVAHRAGRALAHALAHVAPGVPATVVIKSFSDGVDSVGVNGPGAGKVYRFPTA